MAEERGHGEEHQDEFGHKTGNDRPAIDGSGYGGVSESERPRHKVHVSDEPSAGYGDGGLQEEEHGEESYAPAEESTPQTSQFGLEGKTASHGTTGAAVPDREEEEEESHEATTGYGAPAAGSTIVDEDTCTCVQLISCSQLIDTKLNWGFCMYKLHVIGWNRLEDDVEKLNDDEASDLVDLARQNFFLQRLALHRLPFCLISRLDAKF